MKVKKIVIVAAVLVAAGGGVYYYLSTRQPKTDYTTEAVTRGDIIQTVSETGTVKAINDVNLNFLNSGTISQIYCQVGDKVKKDQLLAELDHSSLDLSAKESEANLQVARQNLAKLLSGATAEDIRISQANVKQAETAYQSAQKQLAVTKTNTAAAIAQDQKTLDDLQSLDSSNTNSKRAYVVNVVQGDLNSINTALDAESKIITDQNAKYSLSVTDPILLTKTQTTYNNTLPLLSAANKSWSAATQNRTDANIAQAVSDVLSALNSNLSSLNYLYSALQDTVVGTQITQTQLDTYKSTISSAISTINTGISTVQAALQSLNDAIINAQNALQTAQLTASQQVTTAQASVDSTYNAWQVAIAQLNKVTAAPSNHDVSLLQAQIQQAQAALDSVEKKIGDSKITAPIDGTITAVNSKVGEQVTAASLTPVISLLNNGNFDIEVLIPESDIQKIALNDKVETTLDAFGDDQKFYGQVYFVDPAETTVQDVIYYRVKINFDPAGKEIKSGMTANVIVTTAQKQNVLLIPTRAVIQRTGDGKYVKVLVNNTPVEKNVEMGLTGDSGMSEVLSGVNEGDKVITYSSQSN